MFDWIYCRWLTTTIIMHTFIRKNNVDVHCLYENIANYLSLAWNFELLYNWCFRKLCIDKQLTFTAKQGNPLPTLELTSDTWNLDIFVRIISTVICYSKVAVIQWSGIVATERGDHRTRHAWIVIAGNTVIAYTYRKVKLLTNGWEKKWLNIWCNYGNFGWLNV